jgi:hypothetical protein
MGHITTPLLQPRVVAGLIGLSPAALRRWDAALLPHAGRRPRRYSWAEVEVLQRAVHQASGRGGMPAAFQGTRGGPRRASAQAADGARRRSRAAGRRTAGGRGVVSVPLPRSARRRDRLPRH